LGAGIGAVAGLFYTALQIRAARFDQRSNEIWRRTEFARGLTDRLSTDDELSFCTRVQVQHMIIVLYRFVVEANPV
jgi:hypothetical protein